MNGYLGWESVSAGKNCYGNFSNTPSNERRNCLGGTNGIPSNRRNMLIVRHEDYVSSPRETLAKIFSFASRGVIDAKKDKDWITLIEGPELENQTKKLEVSHA